jgi:diguanylate cyclase (GGDEF)-like protein
MMHKINTIEAEPLWLLPRPIRDRLRVGPQQLEYRHFLFCGIYAAIAVFFLIFFGIAALLRDEPSLALVIFGFAVATTISYISIWLSGLYYLANHMITLLMACLCLYLFYTGGAENTGPIYYFVFPMVALYLQGVRAGSFSVIALLLVTWALQNTGMFGFDTERYAFTFYSRVMTVYVIVCILSFMFAYFRDQAERELLLSEGDLEQIVYSDLLTGLANQNLMNKLVYAEANRYQRYPSPFCLILLEIDQYQKLHLRFGNEFTNQVLVGLAGIFTRVLRRQDIPGRWESHRFLILAPETTLEGAHAVAQRLCDAIARQPFVIGTHVLGITASIGLAQATDKDVSDTLHRADELLMLARRLGGNRVLDNLPELSAGGNAIKLPVDA